MRTNAAPLAEALWEKLRRAGRGGISAQDAAAAVNSSPVYARKTLRVWTAGGLAEYLPPETTARDASGLYRMAENAPKRPPLVAVDGTLEPREGTMPADEMAAIRRKLDLSLAAFGRALGLNGHDTNLSRQMRRYETGGRPIQQDLADRARSLSGTKPSDRTKKPAVP